MSRGLNGAMSLPLISVRRGPALALAAMLWLSLLGASAPEAQARQNVEIRCPDITELALPAGWTIHDDYPLRPFGPAFEYASAVSDTDFESVMLLRMRPVDDLRSALADIIDRAVVGPGSSDQAVIGIFEPYPVLNADRAASIWVESKSFGGAYISYFVLATTGPGDDGAARLRHGN